MGVKRHFLVYPNYQALLEYNCVNAYGLERRPARRPRRSEPDERPMSLLELEALLRERLAGTLPGLDAQLRFMPTPPRTGWKPGEFPSDARIAAGLLLLYPGERGAVDPLTVRASGLRRHAGQVSLPGGATDPGETLGAGGAARGARGDRRRSRARVRILGELTPVHVLVSGFTLHPVVGITHQRPSFAARRARSGDRSSKCRWRISRTRRASGKARARAKASRSSIPTSI